MTNLLKWLNQLDETHPNSPLKGLLFEQYSMQYDPLEDTHVHAITVGYLPGYKSKAIGFANRTMRKFPQVTEVTLNER